MLAWYTHRRVYVRRLDGARTARGAGRACDPGEVEMHQQRLAASAGDRDVRDMRRALALPAVDHGVGDDGEQAALQLVAQLAQPRRERLLLRGRQAGRHAQPDDARHILGSGANPELLAAAVD